MLVCHCHDCFEVSFKPFNTYQSILIRSLLTERDPENYFLAGGFFAGFFTWRGLDMAKSISWPLARK